MAIRCLIVDDHTLFREGLRRLLESEAGIEVVGEARDASEAIERAHFLKPDVILMDIGMPGLSSFEASRRITRELPGRRVIFLTMYEDEEYLLQCLDAAVIDVQPPDVQQWFHPVYLLQIVETQYIASLQSAICYL